MKTSRVLASILLFAIGLFPHAGNSQGMLVGAGGLQCSQITTEEGTHRDAMNWLIGYLFARDLEGNPAGEAGYVLKDRTSEELLTQLIATCRAHPSFKLERAAIELHWQLTAAKRKLR
ncbi:hypothetical protein KQ910_24950 [Reyranella sp. MMS21-HV4-11]|uniref:Rap1a immunity protein domain-containing protein n=1 Tax=Reyranella humidisoli TaxID=2849149 RepID=A0ABS6IR31_9HYPH|nr:hypothetical protein [Reyranella sp. MMS21-HV4-11]MBU8877044.1 hypothetical protein [Reyranella sp. MMS21-HV4-11]